MKSFYKVSFLIAGCLIVIGLIFGMVGSVFGGDRQLHDMAKNGELSYGSDLWFWWDHWREDEDDLWEDIYLQSEESGYYPADTVKNLNIEIGGAELNIEPYDGTEYQLLIVHPEKFEYGIADSNTLYIRSKEKSFNDRLNKKVQLFVPEKTEFERVVLNVGAGVVTTYDLSCDDLVIEVGAGEYIGEHVTARDMKCAIGAGTMNLSNASVGTSGFNIGVGSAYVSGKVSGDTDIECGMGSIRLDLEGDVEDYNYRISCSAGLVDLDGETISAISGNRRINNKSDVTFDIDCAMGSVEIDF